MPVTRQTPNLCQQVDPLSGTQNTNDVIGQSTNYPSTKQMYPERGLKRSMPRNLAALIKFL